MGSEELFMGKKALVTGGSRGIGVGIVSCLARVGYDVALNYYSAKDEAGFFI